MYRILTEDKDLATVRRILDAHFDGYTVYKANGVWKGEHENSLVIEIDFASAETVRCAASEIKTANNQQAVLIQTIPVESELI